MEASSFEKDGLVNGNNCSGPDSKSEMEDNSAKCSDGNAIDGCAIVVSSDTVVHEHTLPLHPSLDMLQPKPMLPEQSSLDSPVSHEISLLQQETDPSVRLQPDLQNCVNRENTNNEENQSVETYRVMSVVSSEDSDSDSSSSSCPSSSSRSLNEGAGRVDNNVDTVIDDEDDVPRKNKIKCNGGDIPLEDLPPIADLHITVKEDQCVQIGTIHSIVDSLVVVQSLKNVPALNLESVLFLEGGKPLGLIFDVLGQVTEPLYAVRFNNAEQITQKELKIGQLVFCAPKTEHTTYVFVSQLMKMKGSDASWLNDTEPPDFALDYSDDEQERRVKKGRQFSGQTPEESSDGPRPNSYERSMNERNNWLSTIHRERSNRRGRGRSCWIAPPALIVQPGARTSDLPPNRFSIKPQQNSSSTTFGPPRSSFRVMFPCPIPPHTRPPFSPPPPSFPALPVYPSPPPQHSSYLLPQPPVVFTAPPHIRPHQFAPARQFSVSTRPFSASQGQFTGPPRPFPVCPSQTNAPPNHFSSPPRPLPGPQGQFSALPRPFCASSNQMPVFQGQLSGPIRRPFPQGQFATNCRPFLTTSSQIPTPQSPFSEPPRFYFSGSNSSELPTFRNPSCHPSHHQPFH